MAIIIDTSILGRLANRTNVAHGIATAAISELHRRGETWHIAPQNLMALQDNWVLQVYSPVCNTIPKTMVWQEGEDALPLPRRGQLGKCVGRAPRRSEHSRKTGFMKMSAPRASQW
jgi:hypothetical protein